MGEILGLGVTHYPSLTVVDEGMLWLFKHILSAPLIDHRYKDRRNWPAPMVAEMGADEGLSAGRHYRARMWENFRRIRRQIDDFAPDFVVIFGDDQYENFRDDIIPPFCILGLDDDFALRPWLHGGTYKQKNYWGEPDDWTMPIHGHREGAKYLTTGLLRRGIAMPYAYRPLHHPGLAHAFTNTLLYLDCDRRGFPYPVIPFDVNCYGSVVIKSHGGWAHLFKEQPQESLPDPPGPAPALCMEVGAKLAQVVRESPYRVALIASSSWSHCFLTPTNGWVLPDYQADRLMLEALARGDYDLWRRRTIAQTERAGQHEMLNWMVLAGAMAELGLTPQVHDYIETYIFQSDKCFVSFPAA